MNDAQQATRETPNDIASVCPICLGWLTPGALRYFVYEGGRVEIILVCTRCVARGAGAKT